MEKNTEISNEMQVIALLSGYVRELQEGKEYENTTYELAKTIVAICTPIKPPITTQEVIDKYFKNDGRENRYFHSSDKMKMYEGDTYLFIKKSGIIELWFGSDNGEVCLMCTHDGEKLENLIKLMIG